MHRMPDLLGENRWVMVEEGGAMSLLVRFVSFIGWSGDWLLLMECLYKVNISTAKSMVKAEIIKWEQIYIKVKGVVITPQNPSQKIL